MLDPWIKANWKRSIRRWQVNINILGISELKLTEMGEFNSENHYIYYCGQESLRGNGVAIIVNKKVWNAVLGCNLKNNRITVIQVYALTSNAEEAEQFYKDRQDLLELTPQKDFLFTIGDWNAKVGNQEIPGVTGKFGLGVQNEAGQRLIRVLPRECTGHSKHPLPTTQEKTLYMDITRWSILKLDWFYSLQPKTKKLHTVSKSKTSWLWLRSWTPYCQIQT